MATATVAAASDPSDLKNPVLAEIVRLLEAGLGEPLILRWLAESGKTPGRPTADDLVGLKKAGASDPFIATLLDRSAAGTAESKPAPAAPASPPRGAPPPPTVPETSAVRGVPADASPATSPEPPAPVRPATPETPASAVASAATVLVSASLRYVHLPDEGDAWDLVVYLDGTPFEPLPAAPSSKSADTWTSQRQLAPGHHLLRWSQELHHKGAEGGATHAARFDPEPLVFELAAGAPAAIEFEFRDRAGLFLRPGGPVTVHVTQGGSEVATRNSSGDPASWPPLCDEIEASLAGKKPGFDDRQALRHCARWGELWSGLSDVPDRDQVRPPLR